ncbi:MAG: D-aminoacylase, partial [Bifidobacteriaceae bacterium]|nr:D-aminoacylase [Bifidobacteriaceae bacterium]
MPATLITGATVIDGAEQPRYQADVLIRGETIEDIATKPGAIAAPAGARRIDAAGLVLSPGFIDMHSHADLQILADPAHLARLNQGITTEVVGQDGLSYAPITDQTLPELRAKVAGWNGDSGQFDIAWRSVGQYLDRLDRGVATNVCYLAPHGTIRAVAAGWGDQPLTERQLDQMSQLLDQALADGAVGLSTGLTYTPAMYADQAELERLCAVVARRGGYFCPHTRSYGAGALEAYREAISVAQRTGCGLHLTHATLNFQPNKGKAPEFLALVDQAVAQGLDLTLDSYPYLPGSTTLSAILPSWFSAGGVQATLDRLESPAELARLRQALEVDGSDGCHGVTAEWDTLEIAGVFAAALQPLVGSTLAQIAAAQGREPFEALVDVLRTDRLGTLILQHVGDESNVQAIMRHPRHLVGSDGLLAGAKPHPRAWGTCAEYLARYRRDLGIFSLEELIGHLTGRAARRLKLHRRGLVRQGWAADLVLFDPATVAPGATFDNPRAPSRGISHVFVAGQAA